MLPYAVRYFIPDLFQGWRLPCFYPHFPCFCINFVFEQVCRRCDQEPVHWVLTHKFQIACRLAYGSHGFDNPDIPARCLKCLMDRMVCILLYLFQWIIGFLVSRCLFHCPLFGIYCSQDIFSMHTCFLIRTEAITMLRFITILFHIFQVMSPLICFFSIIKLSFSQSDFQEFLQSCIHLDQIGSNSIQFPVA